MSHCAICADITTPADLVDSKGRPDPNGQPRRRPLGRDDAPVIVCASCDSAPVRVRGPASAYEVPERCRIGRTLTAFANAANAINPAPLGTRSRLVGKTASPGFRIVRVRRRPPGKKPIDAVAAKQTLHKKRWFAELRFLGTDETWHLFERPDPDAGKRKPPRDVIGELRDEIKHGGRR